MTKIFARKTAVFLLLLLITGLLLQACSAGQEGIQVGAQAPDFTLPSSEGTEVSLSDYTGEQPVLLFFHMANG
jgi:cytochrome oxidase Cu insertion factor (SCO1/SenC/PrrC family)